MSVCEWHRLIELSSRKTNTQFQGADKIIKNVGRRPDVHWCFCRFLEIIGYKIGASSSLLKNRYLCVFIKGPRDAHTLKSPFMTTSLTAKNVFSSKKRIFFLPLSNNKMTNLKSLCKICKTLGLVSEQFCLIQWKYLQCNDYVFCFWHGPGCSFKPGHLGDYIWK